jgi:predicted NACHT family NTPase
MQQRNEDGKNYQIQTGDNNTNIIGGVHNHGPSEIVSSGEKLDDTVQRIREAIRGSIEAHCSTMRVLDMPEPIKLTGENGIYTNVYILEKPSKLRDARDIRNAVDILEPIELRTAQDPDDARPIREDDGFIFGRRIRRLPGLEVVENHPKLMVLGKPGAGKTTFLKYLAMECITGRFEADKVPFFVTLKDFAEAPESPHLVEFLAKKVSRAMGESPRSDKIDSSQIVTRLLKYGRVLILLDGLDEVRGRDSKRIIDEIKDSAEDFNKSFFVITCRIAAREYDLDQFTEVEVADFNDQQIEIFAKNWFRANDDRQIATIFAQRLRQNESIQELASNPLLLTLFCLVFGESREFPKKRADLYEEGVKILLKKWDAKRKIQRDVVYKNLDVQEREDLLSFVAFQMFMGKEINLKQWRIQKHIADYIQNLGNDDPTSKSLEDDSKVILQCIEAQHGLLVERAREVYSFSHLTLQEYFTARQINRTNQPKKQRKLIKTLKHEFFNKRWREVFLLTVELSSDASDLLLEIKKEIDSRFIHDQILQIFLQWAKEKSLSVSTSNLSAVRAFYYGLALNFGCELAWKIEPNFYDKYPGLKLDNALNDTLNRAEARAGLSPKQELFKALSLTEDNDFRDQLLTLYNRLPLDSGRQWGETDGKLLWVQDLRASMISYRNIGHNFSKQRELLRKYYNSNLFLLECLATANYVRRDVRKQIKETLLKNRSPHLARIHAFCQKITRPLRS